MADASHNGAFMFEPDCCKCCPATVRPMGMFLRVICAVLAIGVTNAGAQGMLPAPSPDSEPEETHEAPPPEVHVPADMPHILNDTLAYCNELRQDIEKIRAQQGAISAHIATLQQEGERMCRIGHIRPGIYRLRTALMMLRRGEEE